MNGGQDVNAMLDTKIEIKVIRGVPRMSTILVEKTDGGVVGMELGGRKIEPGPNVENGASLDRDDAWSTELIALVHARINPGDRVLFYGTGRRSNLNNAVAFYSKTGDDEYTYVGFAEVTGNPSLGPTIFLNQYVVDWCYKKTNDTVGPIQHMEYIRDRKQLKEQAKELGMAVIETYDTPKD